MDGVAVTGVPVVALSAVLGAQLYEVPPVPVIVVDTPLQIVVAPPPVPMVGKAFTVIVRVAVLLHVPLLPVTV